MAKIKDIKFIGKDLVSVHRVVTDQQYLYNAGNTVLAAAKLRAPGKTGELRNSIGVKVDNMTAHIGTNKEYAMYVEFGTGPKGQANHAGTSPEIAVTYRQTGWLIPASKAPEIANDYPNWPSITINGQVFYRSLGQAAQPFLYPALKNNEKAVADILEGSWKTALERL